MNSQLREQDMALWMGAGVTEVKDANGKHRITKMGFEVENRNKLGLSFKTWGVGV